MSATKPPLPQIAVDAGLRMVGQLFRGRRADQCERHLSRAELAALLAIAFEDGMTAGGERPRRILRCLVAAEKPGQFEEPHEFEERRAAALAQARAELTITGGPL